MQTTLVVVLKNENHFISRWLGRTPTQIEIAAAFYGATTTDQYGATIIHEAESAILITGTKTQEYGSSHIRSCVNNLLESRNKEPGPDSGCNKSSPMEDSTHF